jgi:DNA-binding MarR family transcriptional regulator
MKKSRKEGTNPLSIKNIDRTIHEPARFFIMAHLAVVDSMDFLFLMNQTQLTQGNLSAHLSKLESADYIRIKKEFVNKKPRTLLRITEKPGLRSVLESAILKYRVLFPLRIGNGECKVR